MNRLFPYWWFHRKMPASQSFEYSHYICSRIALQNRETEAGSLRHKVQLPSPSPERILEWNYQFLSYLDTKASALMRLNGVMIAAAALFMNSHVVTSVFYTKAIVAGSTLLSAFSIALCLIVVSVDWSFLGLVKKLDPKEEPSFEFKEEFFHLQGVSEFREMVYRIAWIFSFIATAFFIAGLFCYFYLVFK